jgi:hypothetical protein
MTSLEEYRIAKNASRLRARLACLEIYGGCCTCCGESDTAFLLLCDANNKGVGTNRYFAIRREGFPAGYRIFCFNCHMAHKMWGGCPHRSPAPPFPRAHGLSLTLR